MTKLRTLRDALRETWEELHAEKCTNVNGCRSFGGSAACYCPPPPELSGEPNLPAGITLQQAIALEVATEDQQAVPQTFRASVEPHKLPAVDEENLRASLCKPIIERDSSSPFGWSADMERDTQGEWLHVDALRWFVQRARSAVVKSANEQVCRQMLERWVKAFDSGVVLSSDDRGCLNVLSEVRALLARPPVEPSARQCKGGKCPEQMWCDQEQECMWDRWNK